jgi:putative toxin-antitoxin system antitoxin component (TIGR02293 family)
MSEQMMVSATKQGQQNAGELSLIDRAAGLMGGPRVLKHKVAGALDVHEAVEAGLPGSALHHLIDRLLVIEFDVPLERAVGLSRRTFQRTKEDPKRPLSVEQSGRTWKFAEVLALAIDVLGTQELAERWLERPAIGLSSRRPIDLLSTPAGTELVETYLQRIKYGVYT